MKRTSRRNGFTLVELLVVIGIITVLLGMLLPSLTQARQKSNQVVCMSNLRQIGMAMLLYADDHDGYLFPDKMGWDQDHVTPWPATDQSVGTGGLMPNVGTWPTVVFGSWNPPVMLCPSDQDPVGQHSYLVNEHMAYLNTKFNSPPAGISPSNVILMGEKVSTSGDYYMENGDFAAGKVEEHRHGIQFGSNYLKLDMHVDTLQPAEAIYAMDPWDYSPSTQPTTQTSSD